MNGYVKLRLYEWIINAVIKKWSPMKGNTVEPR